MKAIITREILSNIASWRGKTVVVYANFSESFGEKHLEVIIGDMALLVNVDIKMVFACKGKDNKKLLRLARRQGIDAYNIENGDDLLEISNRLNAVKLFFLCEVDGIFDQNGLIKEMTVKESLKKLKEKNGAITGSMKQKVQTAIQACSQGVLPVHFANGKKGGAFLEELLSGKGSGTMIYNTSYKKIRRARVQDASCIARILRDSIGCSATTESVTRDIEHFTVFIVDGYVYAVIMVSYHNDDAEIGCLASSSEEDFEAIHKLLRFAIIEAKKHGKKDLYVSTTKASMLIGIQPWFLKLGFKSQPLKTETHNHTKVWLKHLTKD